MSTFRDLFFIKNQGCRLVIGLFGIKFKIKNNYIGYNISGRGNKVILVKDGKEVLLPWYKKVNGLDISIVGNNNVVKIAANRFSGSKILLSANDAKIEFKKNDRLIQGLYVSCRCGNNQYLEWGENSSIFSGKVFLHEENAGLVVGKDCMFSDKIIVWATDGHAIMDKSEGRVLNCVKQPVIIGENCWIGHGVYLLKNTKLANGTVVGSGSVVTRGFIEENTVLVGNPAKVVKKNIEWDRRTSYEVSQTQYKLR